MNKLAQATAHARAIFEGKGYKDLLTAKKPNRDVLLEVAQLLESDQPLSAALSEYTAWALRIYLHKLTSKSARLAETNYWRNQVIAKAVREMQQFGFKRTRNPEQKNRACGCSIVASALNETGFRSESGKKWNEDAVRAVCTSSRKAAQPRENARRRKALAKALIQEQKPLAGLFAQPPPFERA